MAVSIERTDQNILITLPINIDPIDLQNALNYLKFVDTVQKSKATDDDIDELSNSVKSAMSKNIIDRLKDLEEFSDL